jgi:hypothetical protein
VQNDLHANDFSSVKEILRNCCCRWIAVSTLVKEILRNCYRRWVAMGFSFVEEIFPWSNFFPNFFSVIFLMGQRWDKNFSCIKIKKCATILLIPVPAGSLFLEIALG